MADNTFILSEEIMERLSFINFQKKFLPQRNNNQKIPSEYFAIEINPLEQFEIFKNLVRWLLMSSWAEIADLANSLDPVNFITVLLSKLETMGMKDTEELDIIKVKQGHGKDVCRILTFLLDSIFQSKNLTFKAHVFP